MPQAAHTPIPICKWMDQFKLIVEHAAADEHVYLAGLYPVQQFHHQIRDILGQRSKMQDMPLAVHHTHRPGTKHAGLFHQAPSHNAMGGQQIVHRIGIEFLQPLINFIGIFDFGNVLGGRQNLFAVQNCCHLFQGKGILLNGQGAMDGADAVGTAQGRICGKKMGCIQTAYQLGDLRHIVNDLVCDFKRRLFVLHARPHCCK